MRVPRIRITIGRLMVVVAVVGLILVVATNRLRHDGIRDKRVVVPIASVVAAAYGLGSMRRPLTFLAPLVVTWIVTPVVHDRTPDLIDVSAAGCFVAWVIGAPVGWISRVWKNSSDSGMVPVAPDPPEPLPPLG